MLKGVMLKNRLLEVPIIQGGMGVGVSLGNLAGHVMRQKAMGVISGAHPGYNEKDFRSNSIEANRRAIINEIAKAREISNNQGLLAINIMVATTDYKDYVKAAIDGGADAIISGAGLPLDLPKLTMGNDILLAPIVSSEKAARLILKAWDTRYQVTPDFIVIEGPKAGGHLGFKEDELRNNTCEDLDTILTKVLETIKDYEIKYQRNIPLFVAGGIYDHEDIKHYLDLNASGVQIGTRFIATHECDASETFKQAIIDCKKEDIALVNSPTGFPGRAILNDFMKTTKAQGNIKVTNCLNCLLPCTPSDTPYCISEALIQACKGNINKGLVFTGVNGYKIDKLMSVKDLIKELVKGEH